MIPEYRAKIKALPGKAPNTNTKQNKQKSIQGLETERARVQETKHMTKHMR